tara:strand:- start:7089 stop:7415 length:327 start_codon:yes stop_codon:yes gene_type:complete
MGRKKRVMRSSKFKKKYAKLRSILLGDKGEVVEKQEVKLKVEETVVQTAPPPEVQVQATPSPRIVTKEVVPELKKEVAIEPKTTRKERTIKPRRTRSKKTTSTTNVTN